MVGKDVYERLGIGASQMRNHPCTARVSTLIIAHLCRMCKRFEKLEFPCEI